MKGNSLYLFIIDYTFPFLLFFAENRLSTVLTFSILSVLPLAAKQLIIMPPNSAPTKKAAIIQIVIL